MFHHSPPALPPLLVTRLTHRETRRYAVQHVGGLVFILGIIKCPPYMLQFSKQSEVITVFLFLSEV